MVHHSAMHKPDLPTRRLLLIALCLTGAHSQAQGAALQVAAASSLAGVMPELARGFESQHGGTRLEWRAKGSGLLLDGMAQGQARMLAQRVEVDLGEALLRQPHVVGALSLIHISEPTRPY